MKRLFLLSGYVVALATLVYLLTRSIDPARRSLWLEIYLLVVGATGIFTAVMVTRRAFPLDGGSAIIAAQEREPPGPLRPRELERIKSAVALSTATAFDLHFRLRPILSEVADQRLGDRHGLRLERGGDDVQAVLGPDLWELVRPDQKLPAKRWAAGVDEEALARAVERLEAL
jgi:hypothetical protein